MDKKPAAEAAARVSDEPDAARGHYQNQDVAALLLQVLRNVDREVKTTLQLSTEAQFAVDHFRAISAALSTTPPSFSTSTQPRR